MNHLTGTVFQTAQRAYANYFGGTFSGVGSADRTDPGDAKPPRAWHVLWTRNNFEKTVYRQLQSRGYEVFLPIITDWSCRSIARRPRQSPMFKGYLFLNASVDRYAYLDISNTDGLVSILGHHWNLLTHIPDREIETIRLAVANRIPTIPYPFMESGDKVRVTRGPLANSEGILVRSEPSRGLFVLSIRQLRRSVAVEVDYADVVSVQPPA